MINRKDRSDAYNRGYTCGYEWLTKGRNFVHPSQPKGYIPGGPVAFDQKGAIANKEWREGWIDGINQYVTNTNLEYPAVEKPF